MIGLSIWCDIIFGALGVNFLGIWLAIRLQFGLPEPEPEPQWIKKTPAVSVAVSTVAPSARRETTEGNGGANAGAGDSGSESPTGALTPTAGTSASASTRTPAPTPAPAPLRLDSATRISSEYSSVLAKRNRLCGDDRLQIGIVTTPEACARYALAAQNNFYLANPVLAYSFRTIDKMCNAETVIERDYGCPSGWVEKANYDFYY